MIYLNGKYIFKQDTRLEYHDRGFLLGDGIFETLRSHEGFVCNLSDHFDRLKKSANDLEISFSMPLHELQDIIYLLLEKNTLSCKNASLRITLTRGLGPRGLLPSRDAQSTLLIVAFPFISAPGKPIKTVISDIHRNESSPLSNMKSLCYLDNILARQRAIKSGADDCIFLNTKGQVACGSVSNIFIVNSTGVITPPIADGVLPGITRKIIIDLCKRNALPIHEKSISAKDLKSAKEVFLTNRLIEIQPVAQVDSIVINDGKIGDMITLLKKFYHDYLATQIKSIKEERAKIP